MNRSTTVLNLAAAMLAASVFAALVILTGNAAHANGTYPNDQLETTRHGVIVRSTLPHCTSEDGSGSVLPCTWNVGAPVDGFGGGVAYVLDRVTGPHGHRPIRADYVWSVDPSGHGWHWTGRLSDCVARGTVERCADGSRNVYAVRIGGRA